MEEIELVLDARATIGESPTWVAAENALYWIDVKAPCLHRLDFADGGTRRWNFDSDVGAFALHAGGGPDAVVALRQGIYGLAFSGGEATLLAAPPFDTSLFRFNEGACDADGRFWVGVMFDPEDGSDQPARRGSLHSFMLDGGLRAEPDAAELHNGMAWSADGGTFYLSHSQERAIYAFDFQAGRLLGKRLFAALSGGEGIPDGAAVDAEGGYWCAVHGGWRLQRYTADGRLDREVMLPVSQPTMCAFAGRDLDVMYVTSARQKLGPEQLEREPLAGGLFRFSPGVRGVPRACLVR